MDHSSPAPGLEFEAPIIELRKPAVRVIARAVGLPAAICERPPFPGPALAARVVGAVTREKIATVRKATAIVEEELCDSGAFQYLAIQFRKADADPGHWVLRCPLRLSPAAYGCIGD